MNQHLTTLLVYELFSRRPKHINMNFVELDHPNEQVTIKILYILFTMSSIQKFNRDMRYNPWGLPAGF